MQDIAFKISAYPEKANPPNPFMENEYKPPGKNVYWEFRSWIDE